MVRVLTGAVNPSGQAIHTPRRHRRRAPGRGEARAVPQGPFVKYRYYPVRAFLSSSRSDMGCPTTFSIRTEVDGKESLSR